MSADQLESLRAILDELGVPADYGREPELPVYTQCLDLIDVGPNIIGRMQQLEPSTAAAWQQMLTHAMTDGINLLLVSGFRTIDYQAGLIRKKIEAGQQIEEILKVNVAPGYSQHHTGCAIDVATPGFKPLQEEFDQSNAFAWLTDNAPQFGFTLSYPKDNALGIIYEPWHWFCTLEDSLD